jgi:hypothetical protein
MALSHWTAAQAGDGIPEISAIMTRDRDLARHEFLIKLDATSGQGVFIRCGEGVGFGRGGKAVGSAILDTIPEPLGDLFSDACIAAQSTLRPVDREGEAASEDDADIRYRAIFMPVRSMSGEPGYIFGALTGSGLDASATPT